VSLSSEIRSHEEWVHAFEEGLKSYRSGAWDDARAAFGACLSLRADDKPAKVFLERIEQLSSSPVVDWDGVWKMNSK
jgi:hypothetical protein